MFERRTGCFPVIFEEQNVFEAPIFLKIENAIPKRPQNIFDLFGGKPSQGDVVIGRLNDHLVSADAVHLVEHPLRLLVQTAFNAECRELVGNDPNRPTRPILHGSIAVRIWAICQNFWRSFIFVAGTEGAESTLDFDGFAREVGRPLGAIRGNNYPSTHDRIFSQLRQTRTPSTRISKSGYRGFPIVRHGKSILKHLECGATDSANPVSAFVVYG